MRTTAESPTTRGDQIIHLRVTPQLRHQVRLLAARDDVSMAEWTRRLIAERVAEEPDAQMMYARSEAA